MILLPAPDFSSLVRVAVAGGSAPSAVTTLDATTGETHHGFPLFLPDGRHFLFSAYSSLVPLGTYVGSLDSPRRVRLLEGVSNTQYANGSLIFRCGRICSWPAGSPTPRLNPGELKSTVMPFPGPGAKRQVSDAAGNHPRWRRDGKELFYWNPDGQLMAAAVRSDAVRLDVEAVRPLFAMRSAGGGVRSFYDVSSDGQRFLHSVSAERAAATPITLVTNWPALVKKD